MKRKKEQPNTYLYAFDLSMECTGLVIFDISNNQPVYITSIPTNKQETHGQRLHKIAQEVLKLIDIYTPSVIAIERGFSRFNTSTQVIYRVHGLINYIFKDYAQIYYPPKKIKEVILKGTATKQQVQNQIYKHYTDIKFKNEDESDAFAIGLTYLIENKKMIWEKKK